MEGKTQESSNIIHVAKEGGEDAAFDQASKLAVGDIIWVKLHGASWWPAQIVDENNVSSGIKPRVRSVKKVLVRLYGSYKYLYVDPITSCSDFENILKENNGSYTEIFKKALEQGVARVKSDRSKGKVLESEVMLSKERRSRKRKLETGPNNVMPNIRKSPRTTARKLVFESVQPTVMNGSIIARSQKQAKVTNARTEHGCQHNNLVHSPKTIQIPPKETPKNTKLNKSESATAPAQNCHNLSARRVKIMQSLGLIAPSGSPFLKNNRQNSHSPVLCV